MNGWLLAIIVIYMVKVGLTLTKHGEKRQGKYNFWVALFDGFLWVSITYMAIQTGF